MAKQRSVCSCDETRLTGKDCDIHGPLSRYFWRPFKTAPRDGSHFLAASKLMGQPTVEMIWWDRGYGSWQGAHTQTFDAWMPAPNPPSNQVVVGHAEPSDELEAAASASDPKALL